MDETLRLQAEIVDKFSTPLRQLRDGIKSIQSGPGVQRVHSDLTEVGRQVTNVAGSIRNLLVPALSAAGLAGMGLGAGLASISTAFAATTNRLSQLSYQTGVTMQTMRELQALAPRIGMNEGAMQAGVQNFSMAMDQIKRRQGETYAEMARKAPQLAQSLVGSKSMDEAVSSAMSFLAGVAKEKGPAQARLWSQILFGTEDFANVGQFGVDGLRKLLRDIRGNLGELDPQVDKTSKAFKSALHDMQETATGLRDAIGAEVLPMLTDLAKSARSFVSENRESIRGGIVGFIDGVKAFDWAGFAASLKATATAVGSFVESIGGWKTVVIGLVALKGISLAAPILQLSAAIAQLTISLTALPLAKLAGFLGLLGAGGIAAGVAGAVGIGLGMGAIADSRSKSLIPETNAELARKRAQRDELAGKLSEAERLGLGDSVTGRLRERIGLTDREIKALEERLARAAEAGIGDGAEKAQPRIERETKSTFQKLKDWLSLSSFGGEGGGQFGGARIMTAGFGGSSGYFARGYGAGRYGGGSVPSVPLPRVGRVFPNGGIAPFQTLANDPMLDLISRAEGTTRDGYNTTLDYGRWTGGPQNLVGMTLDQIDQLQTQMLANPENRRRYGNGKGSSALGRYQIVRKTLRGLRERLGLSGSQLYDEGMQNRLATALLLGRGRNPAGLRSEWEGLRRVPDSQIADAWNRRQRMAADGTLGRTATADGAGFDAERRRLGGLAEPGDLRWKPDSGVELLRKALRSGVSGSGINRIQGDASLRIDLNGFPRGTKTSSSFDGLFKSMTLNRGKAMPVASEDI